MRMYRLKELDGYAEHWPEVEEAFRAVHPRVRAVVSRAIPPPAGHALS